MDIPLMLVTTRQFAAGYKEFDGFDASGRVRFKSHPFRATHWHADVDRVEVLNPSVEAAIQIRAERERERRAP